MNRPDHFARLARLALLLLVALAWLPAAPLVADPDPAADAPAEWDGRESRREADAAITEYFSATDERRVEIEQFLDGLGVLRSRDGRKYEKDVFDALKKSATAAQKIDMSNPSGVSFTHGSLTGRVYVAGNVSGQKQPLLIGLHGGGQGVGDGQNSMQKWRAFGGTGIVICPTAPELRGTAWNHADIEQWVIALIEAAKNTWDVDSNRIYMAGHSMGGFGTWSIGCKHADRMAAISPNAGGIFANPGNQETGGLASGHIPNLLNTPVWFYHSTDDPQVGVKNDQLADAYLTKLKEAGFPFEWVYKEYTNRGHGLPADGPGPIIKWLGEHTRNPYPARILWEPSRGHKQLFFWVEATNTEAQYGATGRIEGQIDKATNSVKLTSSGNVGNLTVYLNESMVDLEKPVTISLNGQVKFEGRVYPRLGTLLHSAAATRDLQQYYTCRVDLSGRSDLRPAPEPKGDNGAPSAQPDEAGMPTDSGDKPVAPAPTVDAYPKDTSPAEFERFMKCVADCVPRGHRVNRDATSVTSAIGMLNETYRDKLIRLLEYQARAASGDERKLLREIADLVRAGE